MNFNRGRIVTCDSDCIYIICSHCHKSIDKKSSHTLSRHFSNGGAKKKLHFNRKRDSDLVLPSASAKSLPCIKIKSNNFSRIFKCLTFSKLKTTNPQFLFQSWATTQNAAHVAFSTLFSALLWLLSSSGRQIHL